MENTEPNIQPTIEETTSTQVNMPEKTEHTVPLSALTQERKKLQGALNEEKQKVKNFEELINTFSKEPNQQNNKQNPYIKDYEAIKKTFGQEKANEYLEVLKSRSSQQNQDTSEDNPIHKIKANNQSIINEINNTFSKEMTIPSVKEAFDLFMDMDIDHNESYDEQNVMQVMQQASKVYNEGYKAGLDASSQNTEAKNRLTSSIKSSQETSSSAKTFTRSDIAKMNTDTFSQNEEEIFSQLKKGLIK